MKDIDYDAILAGKTKQEGMDDDTFNEYMGYNKKFHHTELVIGIIFCIAVIIGACLFYQVNKLICISNAAQMGFECNYDVITGCKIKLENGHYINIDKYRGY